MEESKLPRATERSALGTWVSREGMPAYEYTADQTKNTFARHWLGTAGEMEGAPEPHRAFLADTSCHWHQVANDEALAIATNHGHTQMFDFTRGGRWMNACDTAEGHYGGGYSYVAARGAGAEAQVVSTLYLDRPAGASTSRVFGVGFADYSTTVHPGPQGGTLAGLEVARRVMAPFGTGRFLITRVELRNHGATPLRLRHFEFWDINPRVLSSNVAKPNNFAASKTLRSEITTAHGGLVARETHTDATVEYAAAVKPSAPAADGPLVFLLPLGAATAARQSGFDADQESFFGPRPQPPTPPPTAAVPPPSKPPSNRGCCGRKGTTKKSVVVEKSAAQKAAERAWALDAHSRRRRSPAAPTRGGCSGSLTPKAGDACLVLQSDVDVGPGDCVALYFAYGYHYGDVDAMASALPSRDPAAAMASTLRRWREWLPKVNVDAAAGIPTLGRELAWHAYYTRSLSLYEGYLDKHTLTQGFFYLFSNGDHAAPRDTLQAAITMVYLQPNIARDSIESVMMEATPDGELPYSITGYHRRTPHFWYPCDSDAFLLWAATEYLFATRDFGWLDEELPYAVDYSTLRHDGIQATESPLVAEEARRAKATRPAGERNGCAAESGHGAGAGEGTSTSRGSSGRSRRRRGRTVPNASVATLSTPTVRRHPAGPAYRCCCCCCARNHTRGTQCWLRIMAFCYMLSFWLRWLFGFCCSSLPRHVRGYKQAKIASYCHIFLHMPASLSIQPPGKPAPRYTAELASTTLHDHPSAVRASVWHHLQTAYRHLVEVVGVGDAGMLRMRHADWNDSVLASIPLSQRFPTIDRGETTLLSAFAAFVLPRFAVLADRQGAKELAQHARETAAGLRRGVAATWSEHRGKDSRAATDPPREELPAPTSQPGSKAMGWFGRGTMGNGRVMGQDWLSLEPQPWAVLSGISTPHQTRDLLRGVEVLLRRGSPLGARLAWFPEDFRFPTPREDLRPGEFTHGGVWLSINHTLIWAAARAGYRDLAWDEFKRSLLSTHEAAYPDQWVGVWSGPDAYNAPDSERPGWVWDLPAMALTPSAFPIQNCHAHCQPLLSFFRLAGVECDADGVSFRPNMPAGARYWDLETSQFCISYSETAINGSYTSYASSLVVSLQVAHFQQAPEPTPAATGVIHTTAASSDAAQSATLPVPWRQLGAVSSKRRWVVTCTGAGAVTVSVISSRPSSAAVGTPVHANKCRWELRLEFTDIKDVRAGASVLPTQQPAPLHPRYRRRMVDAMHSSSTSRQHRHQYGGVVSWQVILAA